MCLLRKLKSRLFAPRLVAPPFEPRFYIRICRKKAEFIALINEASNPATSSAPDLIKRTLELLIEENEDNSVFGVLTNDPLDPGHALGLVAESISQNDFVNKKNPTCNRCTIFLPADKVHTFFTVQHTPKNNMNFAPADERHFDIRIQQSEEFAKWLLNGFATGTVRYLVSLKGKGKGFQTQARVAHAMCLGRFGILSEQDPPKTWRDGTALTSAQQISILRYLASPDDLFLEKEEVPEGRRPKTSPSQ